MTRAYYNEHDPKAAAWLRELIRGGHIADGDVDERSITEIKPEEIQHYAQCHFFAGIGGWSLALRLAGWPDEFPVWTGSCPCQPFSNAGAGRGTADERHLWPVFARLIGECRPSTVFGEQVASKAGRDWLAGVFADLEGMGYQRAGADLCAAGVGAPHIRQRLYWLACSNGEQCHEGLQPLPRGSSERAGSDCEPHDSGGGPAYSAGGQREQCLRAQRDELQRPTDDRANSGLADSNGGQSRDGGIQRSGRHDEQPQDEAARGLADVLSEGQQGRLRGREDAEREDQHGHAGRDGATGGMAHTIGSGQRGRDERGLGESGQQMAQQENGADSSNESGDRREDARGMGHTDGEHTGRNAGASDSAEGGARLRTSGDVLEPSGATGGFWTPSVLIPCRDGKARRTQPGLFPLAHGVSGRVGLLRGYGNAILAPLAAEFIAASREAIRTMISTTTNT